MKFNIFSVPSGSVQPLKAKFGDVGLKAIHQDETSGWQSIFYFSTEQEPASIPWVETYAEYFGDSLPTNLIYFAAYLFEKDGRCYVLSYGKSHFYIRQFCDHDFGIEVVKRIGDHNNTRQTSVRRLTGRRKRQIRSQARGTALDLESGEAVDYLQTDISPEYRNRFGPSAKFGSSILLNAPITKDEIGDLFDNLDYALKGVPRFSLPRTAIVNEEEEISRYDSRLLSAIAGASQAAEFADEGHDVVGVDFVFRRNERYALSCRGYDKLELDDDDLNIDALRSYVRNQRIPANRILSIRVRVDNEGQKSYSRKLKDSLDFVVEGENVMLREGKWVRFNEDYLDQLHTSIDGIAVEEVEADLEYITEIEGSFNDKVGELGYVSADKNFGIVSTRASTPVEAWDLYRDGTVYAVKFGTTQKINYVCDQASLVLEIIRNNANIHELDQELRAYCLWLGFARKTSIARISEVNSLILKHKIDDWARRCRELGIEPRLKFSRRHREPRKRAAKAK
ncbi:hypothetical protein CcI49_30225 [Frankia sp. CcI49]|uniref:DUF6119 family protein n=1 Tax=Frankia sp. CcI49 TaxID=1745382 RepID=UPI00097776F7|nr:DUF6119 family protein [Frankia sp. CcI49]ONH54638.1 hypothetical protein CcI49_30225 [Frankia sp. CcI49]